MQLSAVDSHEDYWQDLVELLQPVILFLEEVAMGQVMLVYMILMDFLQATGFNVKLSRRKYFPLHFAEVYYISGCELQLEGDGINFELGLMDEARNFFKELNIPNSSRNRDIVYKR